MGEITTIGEFGDYKEVAGIKFPHYQSQDMGMMKMEMTIKNIEVNPKLEKGTFE